MKNEKKKWDDLQPGHLPFYSAVSRYLGQSRKDTKLKLSKDCEIDPGCFYQSVLTELDVTFKPDH